MEPSFNLERTNLKCSGPHWWHVQAKAGLSWGEHRTPGEVGEQVGACGRAACRSFGSTAVAGVLAPAHLSRWIPSVGDALSFLSVFSGKVPFSSCFHFPQCGHSQAKKTQGKIWLNDSYRFSDPVVQTRFFFLILDFLSHVSAEGNRAHTLKDSGCVGITPFLFGIKNISLWLRSLF